MKMTKRLTAIFLCFTLMVMLYVPVSAESNDTNLGIDVNTTSLHVGDTIQVTLSVGSMMVSSFTGGIMFDPMSLACVSIEGTRSSRPDRVYLQDSYEDWNLATAVSTVSEANQSGRIGFAWAGTQDTAYPAQAFIVIAFEALAEGDSDLYLYEDSAGTDGKKHIAIVGDGENSVHLEIVAVSYSVSYDANGGTGVPEAQTKLPGEELILSNVIPVRSGYTFLGWSENKNAETAQYNAGDSFAEDADTVLYAVWHENDQLLITSQPVDFTGAAGDSFSFSVAATGKEVAYQWQTFEENNWVNAVFSGNQTDTLTGEITDTADGKRFRCRVTDAYSEVVYSEEAVLHVTAPGITHSGVCGERLTWILDKNGILTISGSGPMTDYDTGSVPWYSYRAQIREAILSEGVTTVGQSAFQDCSALTSVEIPTGVITAKKNAFNGCTALTAIAFPYGFKNVGESAFQGCSSLTSVDIPDSVASFGKSAFSGCSKLMSISIPDGVTRIEQYLFYGCSSLDGVSIPEGVYYIGQAAFYNCSSLTSIAIPESAYSIGTHILYGCSSLTSVSLPESFTYVRSYMFGACTSLTTLGFMGHINKIGSSAFSGCTGLSSVSIPENVTEISDSAFNNCTGLALITIPENVGLIGTCAFNNCSGLANVHFCGTAVQWGQISISVGNEPLLNAVRSYGAFIVTFDANYGAGTMDTQTIPVNMETALTLCSFNRDGYTFAGWNTEADGSGTSYEDGAEVTLDADLTLYAQWDASETAIRSVENISTDDGPACRAAVFCAGANLTAYAARFDADARFLGIETMVLQPGENTFTVLRSGAATVRFYVLNSVTWAPVCEAAEAPELNPQE